jgi:hypothetical protein
MTLIVADLLITISHQFCFCCVGLSFLKRTKLFLNSHGLSSWGVNENECVLSPVLDVSFHFTAEEISLETFLTKLGLVNCLKHLSKADIQTVDSLKKQPVHLFRALGFKSGVLDKLKRAIHGDFPDDRADLEQLRFVTVDEEADDLAQATIKSSSNCTKKKPKSANLSWNVGVGIKANVDPNHAAADTQEVTSDMSHNEDDPAQLLSLGISSKLTNIMDHEQCLASTETKNLNDKGETLNSSQGLFLCKNFMYEYKETFKCQRSIRAHADIIISQITWSSSNQILKKRPLNFFVLTNLSVKSLRQCLS